MAKTKDYTMKVEAFDTDDVTFLEENRVRTGGLDMDHVAMLSESMAKFGQRVPGIVRRVKGQDKVIGEAGEHRFEAIKAFNATLADGEVPMKFQAVVVDHDDEAGLIGAIIENVKRKDMTVFEQADAMAKLVAKGKKQVEVAQIFGVSEGQVSGRLVLAKAPKKLIKMVEEGDMEADAAVFIAGLPVDDKTRMAITEESLRHRNTMQELETRYEEKKAEREEKEKAEAARKEEDAKIKAMQAEYKAQCADAKKEGKDAPKPPKALTEALKKKELTPEQQRVAKNVKEAARKDKQKRKVSQEDAKTAANKVAPGSAKNSKPAPLSRKGFIVALEALTENKEKPLPQSAKYLIARLEERLDGECSDAQLYNAFIKHCVPDAEEKVA